MHFLYRKQKKIKRIENIRKNKINGNVSRSNMHLLWKEMLHIYKDRPTMNKQLKSELFCLLIGQKTKDNI